MESFIAVLKALRKNKLDLFSIFLILLTAPLFFYKLGSSSLVSWDEGWYAEVARNILQTGDLLRLQYNGEPFADHPPTGFWLMATSFKIFGINEFAARAPSALAGLLGLVVVYFLGKELFGRWVGFFSAIALSSSPWYLFRARSGNLDVYLAFFFILTIFLVIKAVKDNRYLIPFTLSLTLLLLTKTMVPFAVLPALLIIFASRQKSQWAKLVVALIVSFSVFAFWYKTQLSYKVDFEDRYFFIGMPGIERETGAGLGSLGNLRLAKEYLHNGIGKWFWPGIAGLLLGSLFLQRRFLILSVFFVSFFTPFVLSPKTHIWHLIPLYPVMILAFFGFSYFFLNKVIDFTPLFLKKTKKVKQLLKRKELLVVMPLLVITFYYGQMQVKRNWYEFVDKPAFVSDEEILSTEAGKYPYDFYLDDDFIPTAAFYSGKKVTKYTWGDLKGLFALDKPFVLLTYKWRLEGSDLSGQDYKIVKEDRDKILVVRE